MQYNCPNQHRQRGMQFLMCKALMQDGVDYTNQDNALKAFCGFQYYCRITGQCENTPEAARCLKNE